MTLDVSQNIAKLAKRAMTGIDTRFENEQKCFLSGKISIVALP